ncbi:2-hydroxyacid dehydrogenase [Yoonia sediminilitoris]|uniref:Lactate dehydrogenase-like 2-hydroxyacid dehydrogenase n=1 Tax=Yoonia sediminilitoris TaxID=1286148 RepID=A0A2T6KPZ0_9RHOB|nr:D-glycerate dehydrogenase [Yoonia sediminilitoris]PUB18626.1 lactate dehydrogenase-like 2-hydroxyacid dehydrogenase [Yoonia sediminilitoris]RCW98794.1 lactate dehydrogenase-like 2-hydroxyacid dehydrogenase [Yoonia sediminilitoris]
MTKPRLWITRRLSDATLERAARDYDVVINHDDTPGSAQDLIAASHAFDAIIPCHSEHFSADVVAQFGDRLQIVANHSVGVDHCDLQALKARGITITNTPDVLSDATAELAMLLMLGAARHAVAGDRIVRSGAWDSWSPAFMVGKQVTGARLGIIGMGRVGRAFAAKARGFDMEIHYFNRSRLPDAQAHGATYHDSIESLLGVADFLSLHCPATPQTADLMNADRLALLPQGAVLVNTARGALVDEDALMGALDSGQVAAAGLDCFKTEPGGNPAFAQYDNIFMLPHIGSATVQTRDAMGFRALDNLDAYFAGKAPGDAL